MRLLALFLACSLSASAADVSLVRVFTGWRDAASFKRISEYFTGRENTAGETVLRTQPAARSGYYFLVRTDNDRAPFAATLAIQVVLPNSPEPRLFKFPVDLPAGNAVYNLGLTGTDWPDREVDAVAWKLELLGSGGEVLAARTSYLWEKPAK